MAERDEMTLDGLKRGRGRPKGSKNRPKMNIDIEVQVNLRIQNLSVPLKPKMSKKSSKKSSLDTFFTIKPRYGSKCYYQTEITVDYTPHKEQEHDRVSIVPRLNTDSKPHIPGFVMEMDRHYYQKNDQRYLDDHKNKILDYVKPKSRLYQPKPGKRHNYCCICKQSYDDYLEHVTSSHHKKAYHQNDFSKQIKSICSTYFQVSRNIQKNDSGEFLTDQTSQENLDDCQILPHDSSTTQKFTSRKDNKLLEKQNGNQFIIDNDNNNNNNNNNSKLRLELSRGCSQFVLNQKSINLAMSNSRSGGSTASTARNIGQNNFPFEFPQITTQSLISASNQKQPQNSVHFSNQNMFPQIGSNNNQQCSQYFLSIPVSSYNNNNNNSDNDLFIQDMNMPQTQINNSNNGMSICATQSNSTRIISSDKNIFSNKQTIIPSNINNNNNNISNNIGSCNLNGKRKAPAALFNQNIESTRKIFKIQQDNIIDLTDEVTIDSKNPLLAAAATSIPQQNIRYVPSYVV